jgi:hypothetical protein
MKKYHFSYDVKNSKKWKDVDPREIIIEFFIKDGCEVNIEQPCASTLIISYNKRNSIELFEEIRNVLSKDFWFFVSSIGANKNTNDLVCDYNEDEDLAVNIEYVIDKVIEKINKENKKKK